MNDHTCHHPDCNVKVPPALFMCKSHWFGLPLGLRREIWRTYRKGQEIDKNPSIHYLAAAKAAIDWYRKL